MNKNILHEVEALKSEISDSIQLRTLDRIADEIKRLQEIDIGFEELYPFHMEWLRRAVERNTKK